MITDQSRNLARKQKVEAGRPHPVAKPEDAGERRRRDSIREREAVEPARQQLIRKGTLTTTSASGLSKTTQTDINGDGTYDATETDVIVANADGSRTETVTDTSASGALAGKTITTTSANGLTQTSQADLNGDGAIDRTVTDAIVLNADGSRTDGDDQRQWRRPCRPDQGHRAQYRRLDHANRDRHGGQWHPDQQNGDDGQRRWPLDISGIRRFRRVHPLGHHDPQQRRLEETKREIIEDFSNDGTLLSKRTITTSGNGLSVATQTDADGDGVLDRDVTDVTVLNADGSKTETLSTYKGAGTILIGKVAKRKIPLRWRSTAAGFQLERLHS